MNLSDHFTLAELTASDYAIRHGIDNRPGEVELENLSTLAAGLERVRKIFALPIYINSAYRNPAVNAGVGGSANSDHLRGLAADIVVPGCSPLDVCRTILAHPEIGFAKLIQEGRWTHISFPPAGHEPERMVLTAVFKPGQPTTYTKGLA